MSKGTYEVKVGLAEMLKGGVIMDVTTSEQAKIAENAGAEGSIVVDKVRGGDAGFGYNAQTDEYEDLVEAGVIDPTKVVRTALQNAASIAGLLLTTEAVVVEIPEETPPPPMPGGGGGMGGMQGDPNDPNSLTNGFTQSTQATFQIIESIVGAFGGFAQMLESTYMATHSSFFGKVHMTDNTGGKS